MKTAPTSVTAIAGSRRTFKLMYLIPSAVVLLIIVFLCTYFAQLGNPVDGVYQMSNSFAPSISPESLSNGSVPYLRPETKSNTSFDSSPYSHPKSKATLLLTTTTHVDPNTQRNVSIHSPTTSNVETKHIVLNPKSQNLPSASTPSKPTKPLMPVDPKVWKYEPPTGPLSTRPTGTMHPDSLNPDRTYNTEPPSLPQCHSQSDSVVSIYLESHSRLLPFFGGGVFQVGTVKCNMPNDALCKLVNDDELADAVFRFVYFADVNKSLQYCQGQTLIVFNSEALRGLGGSYQQLDLADVRIDHFLTSDAYWKPICLEFPDIYKGHHPPADPSKRTKAAALFLSDCGFKWRSDYIREVMKYIHVDSYGGCFHNVKQQQSRYSGNRNRVVSSTVESYRMMITFENLIQEDYITEKIWVAYQGGAIPIYMGPPDIYKWVPGNHTFIDPRTFSGPKALAEYMKRVAEDDELYKYHTSNFDWDRTKRMMDKYCPKADFKCRMCELAYEKKQSKAKSTT